MSNNRFDHSLAPCPFCSAPFEWSTVKEFGNGCSNKDCPERPMIHDPIGRPDLTEETWKEFVADSVKIKIKKHAELKLLLSQIDKYYVL